jgi:anti-sigma28 factor (negative regulator of flagellin synthesis)
MQYSHRLENLMRIYDRNLTGAAGAETGRTQETQRPENASGSSRTNAGSHSGDRVEFSQTMGHLSQALAKDGSGRADRIQELAASYQRGTYRPDAAAVSRAMISDALSAA